MRLEIFNARRPTSQTCFTTLVNIAVLTVLWSSRHSHVMIAGYLAPPTRCEFTCRFRLRAIKRIELASEGKLGIFGTSRARRTTEFVIYILTRIPGGAIPGIFLCIFSVARPGQSITGRLCVARDTVSPP